jgi:hypothetical protein
MNPAHTATRHTQINLFGALVMAARPSKDLAPNGG